MASLTGRERRKQRIRKKVAGTGERPRLSVFRSANHIYAQIIDDTEGTTLVAQGSLKVTGGEGKVGTAHEVGKAVAKAALDKGITKVVFDRNGYIYHGRVKALAEGAREGGLNF